jgi:hypothetical protein
VLLEVVDHLQVYFRIFVGVEGEFANEGIEVFDEVAEDGDLGFLLDEGDGFGDDPFLGRGIDDAFVDEGEAELAGEVQLDSVIDGLR